MSSFIFALFGSCRLITGASDQFPIYIFAKLCSIGTKKRHIVFMTGEPMETLAAFDPPQIDIVTNAVSMAEELVSNHYKMSASQWLRQRYDVKTLRDLEPAEIVDGPFAQIIRYRGRRRDYSLESDAFDFYKVCLQDHTILAALKERPELELLPFVLYIATHELIHIVRFSRFLCGFDASENERLEEETRVHGITRDILEPLRLGGLLPVLGFYKEWQSPFEKLQNP